MLESYCSRRCAAGETWIQIWQDYIIQSGLSHGGLLLGGPDLLSHFIMFENTLLFLQGMRLFWLPDVSQCNGSKKRVSNGSWFMEAIRPRRGARSQGNHWALYCTKWPLYGHVKINKASGRKHGWIWWGKYYSLGTWYCSKRRQSDCLHHVL